MGGSQQRVCFFSPGDPRHQRLLCEDSLGLSDHSGPEDLRLGEVGGCFLLAGKTVFWKQSTHLGVLYFDLPPKRNVLLRPSELGFSCSRRLKRSPLQHPGVGCGLGLAIDPLGKEVLAQTRSVHQVGTYDLFLRYLALHTDSIPAVHLLEVVDWSWILILWIFGWR